MMKMSNGTIVTDYSGMRLSYAAFLVLDGAADPWRLSGEQQLEVAVEIEEAGERIFSLFPEGSRQRAMVLWARDETLLHKVRMKLEAEG